MLNCPPATTRANVDHRTQNTGLRSSSPGRASLRTAMTFLIAGTGGAHPLGGLRISEAANSDTTEAMTASRRRVPSIPRRGIRTAALIGAKNNAPSPNPMTATETANPGLSGYHLRAGGDTLALVSAQAAPPTTPYVRTSHQT